MAVPSDSFSESFLRPEQVDRGGQFARECGRDHFHLPLDQEGFCRDALVSVVAGMNGGAFRCACDSAGSEGDVCDKIGGQCPCKENVIGRECTRCRPGFFGFPDCQECRCPPTAQCNEETGGFNVYLVLLNASYDRSCRPVHLCASCDRDAGQSLFHLRGKHVRLRPHHGMPGVHVQHPRHCGCQYELQSGERELLVSECRPCLVLALHPYQHMCSCRDFVEGRTCDICSAGYFSYPACNKCPCDLRGTTENICNQVREVGLRVNSSRIGFLLHL